MGVGIMEDDVMRQGRYGIASMVVSWKGGKQESGKQ
jgi:hypothetical protein